MQVSDDPTDLDAIAQDAEKRDEQERIKRHIALADLKWLMAFKQGRRFVWHLLDQYGVSRTSFNSDALVMAFLEGQRNCGLQLLADLLTHTPERYAEMLGERRDGGRTSSSSIGTGTGSTGNARDE